MALAPSAPGAAASGAADDAAGDAAVEQAVGRADDVAALDPQPLRPHLPADAAAVTMPPSPPRWTRWTR